MDLNQIRKDVDGAEEGVWFHFQDGAKFKIAQWGNKAHKKFVRKVLDKHGRRIDAGMIDDDQADKLMDPQWEFIVTDWEGLTDNGEPFNYSVESLIALRKNPEYKELFEKFARISKEESNFRLENIKELGEELPNI